MVKKLDIFQWKVRHLFHLTGGCFHVFINKYKTEGPTTEASCSKGLAKPLKGGSTNTLVMSMGCRLHAYVDCRGFFDILLDCSFEPLKIGAYVLTQLKFLND